MAKIAACWAARSVSNSSASKRMRSHAALFSAGGAAMLCALMQRIGV